METLAQDIRYAIRMLWKNRGFTAVAVITLALGIGANTALFSVVNGVLLNPLPYRDPARLMSLSSKTSQFQQSSISYLNFLDWQRENHSFTSLAAYRADDFNLTGSGEPERLPGHMISSSFFSVLGVNPILGRDFRPEEDQIGAAPVAMVGDGFWKRRFAGSPDVVGKTLTLDGTNYTVVGVMPGHSPIFDLASDVYVPIGQWNDETFRNRRVSMGMFAVGRLKPGVTMQQARADMEGIARGLAVAYPESNADTSVTVLRLKQDIVGNIQPFLLVLLAAVGFVLLISCANVANLLLARSTGRMREFAIRAAVGATQGRVVRQLLTESVILALVGGALGILLAKWGTQAVLALMPATLPRADEIALDGRVLLFSLGISVLAGVLFGLAPALKTAHSNLSSALQESARGSSRARHRTQQVFVVAETALALVLLVGAGLMIRTLGALWSMDPGFDPNNTMVLSLTLSPQKTVDASTTRASYREVLRRFESLPSVEAAAITSGSTPMHGDSELPFWREGQPQPTTDSQMSWTMWYAVTPGYWQAMKIPLVRGRLLTDADNETTSTVVVIDEEFAHKFFGNEDPIGKRVNLGLLGGAPEIVGVVGHVNHWGLADRGHDNLKAELYSSVMQIPDKFSPLMARGMGAVVRAKAAPETLPGALRHEMANFDSKAVLFAFSPMTELVSKSIASQRFAMTLLAVFAGLALVLASIGIYGVVSYFVSQRNREVGIRMALGAQRSDVLRLILGQGTKMALIGVMVGLAAALILTRLMATMLYGVSAADPITFGAVGLVLTGIAALACYVPARRATRVDPVVALRCE